MNYWQWLRVVKVAVIVTASHNPGNGGNKKSETTAVADVSHSEFLNVSRLPA